MNTDDFEQRVQRQRIRQVPGTWRAEILRNARVADGASADTPFLSRCRELLWPARLTWGPLAVAWAIIFLLHAATPPARPAAASSEMALESLLARQQALARLLESAESAPAAPPQPHSQIHRDPTAA